MLKFIQKLTFSRSKSLEERRFLLAGIVTCVAIAAVLLSSVTTNQGIVFSVGLAAAFLFMVVVIVFTLKTKRVTLGSSVIILVANLAILPVGYLMGGGIFSGAPLWYVIGIVFVFVLFKGFLFWLYLIMSLAAFAVSTYLGAVHPEWVIPISQDGYNIHLDSYIAMACVSVLCGLLFKFQNMVLNNELKRVEQQSQEIEALNKTQNNFFSSMSHEIRTPISTIIGLNEMTMREKQLSPEVLENTLNIQNASKMLLTLINDLLDMSKIQSGKMEIVPAKYDTSRMLSEITNFHWSRATEKNLGFDIQVDESIPPMLYGDETRVKQVVTNLLTNAIKYTEDGSVTLRFGGEQTGPDTFLLRVEVEDTGIGIRKENIPYLFEPFRRIEGKETKHIEGTGLGLSISKQLVDLMGGTISVDSIYTKGSTFRTEIPQKIAQGGSAIFRKPGILSRQQPDYQQSFEAPKAAVLIVDDNEMNRIVCRKLLRATKVQVDLAESGKECLEKAHEKHYDAIFMDHEMPGMDGIETLHNLRQQPGGLCRETPVIALTANAGADWDAFYLEQGFSAYLSKPIQSSRLEGLLLACLPADLVEQSYVKQDEVTPHIFETINKRPFVVTTDSIADLPDYLARENEILVMPYYIKTRQARFKDTVEIDTNNLREYLDSSADNTVHSSPSPVEEYEEFFGNALTESKLVLHLSSSKAISSAYQTAFEAAQSFDNVHVVDSGHISTGLGMMAIRAVELLRGGARPEEVIPELEKYQKLIHSNYLVPALHLSHTKYRSAFLTRMMVNVFNMEPVFVTKKGRLTIRRFMTGYVRSTPEQFVRFILKNLQNADTKRLFVTFSACSLEDREHVLQEIQQMGLFEEVIAHRASASTFINCGPNAFGLIYQERFPQ